MECDIVIVGGGPAGASAAYFLCGHGMDVVLVERLGEEAFRRYHSICGAGVNSFAVKDLCLKNDEILNTIDLLRLHWPGGNTIDMKIDGFIIDRPRLFLRLRKDAESHGLRTVKGSVRSVSQDRESCQVVLADGTVIRSKYVIGADGAYSVVRKQIFGTVPDIMLKVEEFHSDAAATDRVLEFYVSEKYDHFYQWYFPYGKGRCTGAIMGYAEDEPDSVRGVRTIPIGWVPELVKGRIVLIGDAGGLPNPMTAGGLRTAILSAQNAANCILSGKLAAYQKWWEKSRMSDRRFTKVQQTFAQFSDDDYAEFSKYMTHRGLWSNGVHSVLHRPGKAWLYIGCLMCLKYGW